MDAAAQPRSEIPAAGWKDIIWRMWQKIGKDRIVIIAAGVAFYAVLAVFPAIAALVALYGLFALPSSIEAHLDNVAGAG